ncbi:hypothetical protein BLNAU_20969 [Blattamonas nauphoetae]|uniref:Uncharacterized protein n=1 Tax=Blattamonas nauphoetae TaxID=2049346 RepID=A0ABQ9WXC9_9EUKA|nr:hypothetical protein BLNAU_20969 [Blattamonas nauphoetae]
MPPTYTNQEQSETTHQSKPISQQRYTQEDNPHFTQSSFYKPQSSTSRLSSRPSRQPASPRTTPEKSRNSLRMSSNSHHVTLKPHIVCCPQLAFLFVDSGMSDECRTDTNSVRVANTREEGSDSEEPGERAEKNEDSTEDTRENESQLHTRRDKVLGETSNQNDSQNDAEKVNSVNLNNAVSSQPSRDTNRNETEYEADTQTDNDSEKETACECWEERLSPPALQLAVDKHGLVLSNTIIADSMRDEQVDNFSRLKDSFVARQKPNSSLQERRGERKESPADLTRHTPPTTSEEHRLSSLKQEQEHLVDTSASSASNVDLLRMIDSLKATLAKTERQHSAELTRLKEENARLTETMSDFQVRAASLAADESTLEKSLEQTRKKMEMQREINTRLEERLDETKREVDEWIGMNKKKSHSIETFHTTLDQLTTERDTLKANLTATNQSLDESNQRIYTHSSEVSSLLSQKTELERLLSKNWLITIDT